jgi:hypothetical protein
MVSSRTLLCSKHELTYQNVVPTVPWLHPFRNERAGKEWPKASSRREAPVQDALHSIHVVHPTGPGTPRCVHQTATERADGRAYQKDGKGGMCRGNQGEDQMTQGPDHGYSALTKQNVDAAVEVGCKHVAHGESHKDEGYMSVTESVVLFELRLVVNMCQLVQQDKIKSVLAESSPARKLLAHARRMPYAEGAYPY